MVPFAATSPMPLADNAAARLLTACQAILELRLARFLLVGSMGLATDAATFSALSAPGSPDWVARAGSLALATLVTWRLNRRFTFARTGRRPLGEAARYAAVACGAQGFNYGLFLALRAAAPALPPLLALLVSAVAAAGFSFAGQSLVAFRPLARSLPAGRR